MALNIVWISSVCSTDAVYDRYRKVDFKSRSTYRYREMDTINSCSCGVEDETSVHFFQRCPRYIAQRAVLLSKISDIIASDVSVLPKDHLISYYALWQKCV